MLKNSPASNLRWGTFLLVLGVLLLAACQPAGGVEIREAWARQAEIGANSAVYFEIINRGDSDKLLAAQTSIAQGVQLHRSIVDDNGIASMQQQASVDLPAGAQVSFEPGGYHVMLLNLEKDLIPGETLDLTLIFENHEPISFQPQINSP